jgi:hypothetical protein
MASFLPAPTILFSHVFSLLFYLLYFIFLFAHLFSWLFFVVTMVCRLFVPRPGINATYNHYFGRCKNFFSFSLSKTNLKVGVVHNLLYFESKLPNLFAENILKSKH